MDAVQCSILGKRYHIMAKKEPDYVMLMMTTCSTLEHLKGSYTQRRYKRAGGYLVTKRFNYREVFRNHFNYKNQVDVNNNRLHYPISVDRTWYIKCWPVRYHAYFLSLAEVNANYLQGYLFDRVDVEPQLDF